ncbi:MAG: hypothetical protein HY960_08100 [Ignavibacteriae bacterium]|nr:hypothetical protein [Ignavibacteriota bacterium]
MSENKIGLEKEFEYYLAHQSEFVTKYAGKYLVFKNQQIIGIYENELDAYVETSKVHEVGTFLIQQCLPGIENYTQTFHSRAIFR